MKNSASKKNSTKVLQILISILSVTFIVGGAFVIYYFSKGYRVNISDRKIKKTGVLTVETQPPTAQLYINGDSIGRTPRSRTLDVGTHSISIQKDGYREWKKSVDIVEEKSTPLFPLLLLQDIKKSNIWESEGILEKYWTNEDKDYYIFLQKDSEDLFSLWTYRINTPLWNLNPNPVQILTLKSNSILLDISSDGQQALITTQDGDVQKTYIIELSQPVNLDNLTPIESLDLSKYDPSWSKNNRHIILESQEEILSLDSSKPIPSQTPFLLLKKELGTKYLWNTDEEGFFYLLEELHTEEDQTYSYALKQLLPDENNSKYMIEKVHFQKDREFIKHYRENGDSYPEFSNSPICTQSIGEITYFEVNQASNGVYISTDTSTYWYNISNGRYRMICTHPAQLISFSPSGRRILFANGNHIYVFTLEIEDGDYTKNIGTEKVKDITKEETTDIGWLSNSIYIHYVKDGLLHISEKDGDNSTSLMDTNNVLIHTIKNDRKYIVTLERESGNLSPKIVQYRIN